MSMSKKHFLALAKLLKNTAPLRVKGAKILSQGDLEKASLWLSHVEGIAHICSSDNNNFRRSTFYFACNFDEVTRELQKFQQRQYKRRQKAEGPV